MDSYTWPSGMFDTVDPHTLHVHGFGRSHYDTAVTVNAFSLVRKMRVRHGLQCRVGQVFKELP